MASLENLISNAANNVNKGIQERIEKGTFNRIAEGVGSSVNDLAEGLVTVVGMAKQAFQKAKEPKSPSAAAPQGGMTPPPPPPPSSSAPVPPPPSAPTPSPSSSSPEPPSSTPVPPPPVEGTAADEEEDVYEQGLAGSDEFIDQLAKEYELEDADIYIFGLARLMAQTGLFFAQCDGNYTEKERTCIEDFKTMILDNMDDVNRDALMHIFDGIERRYCLNDIIAMTHRLVDPQTEKERKSVLNDISDFIRKIVDVEERVDSPELDLYQAWQKEFIN